VEVRIGDEVRLKKPHPCGGLDWTVVRIGADIGLVCQTCQHRIMLPRSQFERRLKTFLGQPRAGDAADGTTAEPQGSPPD
jgi:hypothetical protein